MNGPLPRRAFLKGCLVVGSIASGGIFTGQHAKAVTGITPADERPNVFGPRSGFSPQVGTLVSMLNWMRGAILAPVQELTVEQLDYLHDPKANTIGALLLHLAATERHYQLHTFEGRKWGDWDNQTRIDWDIPGGLGDEGRKTIKGHDLAYYIDILNKVRSQTLAELRTRDDAWLMQVDPDCSWGPTNNYCKWFHVCEHESHHNGQVTWLKGRLPGVKQAGE